MNGLIDTAMTGQEVAAMKARLQMAGYKVMDFGRDGYSVEVDGRQLWRATHMGNEHFAVRFCERTFPDV